MELNAKLTAYKVHRSELVNITISACGAFTLDFTKPGTWLSEKNTVLNVLVNVFAKCWHVHKHNPEIV